MNPRSILVAVIALNLAACTSQVGDTGLSSEQTVESQTTPPKELGLVPERDVSNAHLKAPEALDCQINGVVVPNGTSRQVFRSSIVPCGKLCEAGVVECKSGLLSGNTDFKGNGCASVCNCKTTWGATLEEGKSLTVFKKSTLECEEKLECNDPSNAMIIKCKSASEGLLETIQGSGSVEEYKSQSCYRKPCSCFWMGQAIAPGSSLAVYKKNQLTSPARCSDVTNMGKVVCEKINGSLVTRGDTNTQVYPHVSCTESASGQGNSESDVGAGTGGGSGGGLGNDVGEGEGFRRRGRPGGEGCNVNEPPYVCPYGDHRLILRESMCWVPGKNGYPINPLLEGTPNFGRVTPGAYFAAYKVKSVGCNDRCANHLAIVRCSGGRMSDRSQYQYSDCVEICP